MRITFVGPLASRFVRNDVDILSRRYALTTIDAAIGRGLKAAFRLASLQIKIIAAALSSEALYFWFADYYSLIPTIVARLLGKKVIVVAGGFDVWYIPELELGARTRLLRWFCVKHTFRFATRIFPVSNYAMKLLSEAVSDHARASVIYNTVDTHLFTWSQEPKREEVLTVTQVDTLLEYRRKGIDLFIKTAELLPSLSFKIVGIRGTALQQAVEDARTVQNVNIFPAPITSEDLVLFYRTASVYCQLSIDETFGVAVIEGMSAGCIPVVSQAPALREVVGELGFVVGRDSIEEIAAAVKSASMLQTQDRKKCQRRALEFGIDRRAQSLTSQLLELGL